MVKKKFRKLSQWEREAKLEVCELVEKLCNEDLTIFVTYCTKNNINHAEISTPIERFQKVGTRLQRRHFLRKLGLSQHQSFSFMDLLFVTSLVAVTLYTFSEIISSTSSRAFVNYDDPANFNTANLNLYTVLQNGGLLGVFEPTALALKIMISATCGLTVECITLTNLIIHCVNTSWAYYLTRHLIHRAFREDGIVYRIGTFWGCLICAIHPMRTEVVMWSSAQPYLICGTFLLGTVHLHLLFQKNFVIRVLRLLCFILAASSKAACLSLPAVLICYDLWHVKPASNKLVQSLFSRLYTVFCSSFELFAAAVICSMIAVRASGTPADLSGVSAAGISSFTTSKRLLLASYTISFYFIRFLYPNFDPDESNTIRRGYCVRNTLPGSTSDGNTFNIAFGCFITLVLSILVCLYQLMKRQNEHTFQLIYFICWSFLIHVILILPTLGIVAVHISSLGADRYVYFSSLFIGPFVIAAFFVYCCRIGRKYRCLIVSMLSFVLLFIVTSYVNHTRELSKVWASSELLWRHSLNHCPDDSAAYSQLGVEILGKGKNRLPEALQAFQEALKIEPRNISALLNRGVAFQMANRESEAATSFMVATHINPRSDVTFYNLGNSLGNLKRVVESSHFHRLALQINPAMSTALNNLAVHLMDANLHNEAIHYMKRAVKVAPFDFGYNYNLAVAQLKYFTILNNKLENRNLMHESQIYREALKSLAIAKSIKPTSPLLETLFEKYIN
eukprot:g4062.t1